MKYVGLILLLAVSFLSSFLPSFSAEARTCKTFLEAPTSKSFAQTMEETWSTYNAEPTTKNLRAHLRATKANLDFLGVQYSVSGLELLIVPSDTHPLNKFSKRLFDRFNTLAFYSPKNLKHLGCEACIEIDLNTLTVNYLNFSYQSIKTGKLTSSEFHEWRHVVETSKLTKVTTTPTLAGDISAVVKTKDGTLGLRMSMEEYFAYYTDSRSALGLYNNKKANKRDTLRRLKSNVNFLREMTEDSLVYLSIIERTVYNTFKENGSSKIFPHLLVDPVQNSLHKGGIEFVFTPTEKEGTYRVRLNVTANGFDFSMVLKNTTEFKMEIVESLQRLDLEEFKDLAKKSHQQLYETYMAVNEIYDVLARDLKTIEDYQSFIHDYRMIINQYQK